MDLNSTYLGFLNTPIPGTPVTLAQILWFVTALILGYVVIKLVISAVRHAMLRAGAPELVAGLVANLVKVIGYVIVVLAALPLIGVDTSTVGLGLSAIMAFVIGFGLQDTWANMAAGIWLATMRPFSKGDFIDVAGYSGVVEEVGIMSTRLKTFDNAVITIPNRSVWGSPMTNYTKEPVRRVTLSVGVAYGTDLNKAISTLLEIARGNESVLKDPAPQAVVTELADSSINLQLRAWVRKEDYGKVRSELIKAVYEGLTGAGIEIPFPQLDVHIRSQA